MYGANSTYERYNIMHDHMYLTMFPSLSWQVKAGINPNDWFIRYVLTEIIPRLINWFTPTQIKYKGVILTPFSYADLEMLCEYGEMSMVRRRRIVTTYESALQQGKPLSYRDIAYLHFTTKNTVAKWITDTGLCGYSLSPSDNDIPSRRSVVLKQYLDADCFQEKITDTVQRNYQNQYTFPSERLWFFCEMLICKLHNTYMTSAAKDIITALCINESQYADYIKLFENYAHKLNPLYNDFFHESFQHTVPIRLLASVATACCPAPIGTAAMIKIFEQYKEVIDRNIFGNEDMSTSLFRYPKATNLEDSTGEATRSPINLHLYSSDRFRLFDGVRIKNHISNTVQSLRQQAAESCCILSEIDLSFMLGISRDQIQDLQKSSKNAQSQI